MTTTYGLTSTGFIPKPLQTVREDLNAALQAAFGASIDLSDRSIFGQLVGILSERFALLWELAETVYGAWDPSKATGFSLDNVSAITGTERPLASYSTVMMTLFGTPGTVVPGGVTNPTAFKTASTGQQFNLAANATIATVPNWAASTTYAVGARVFSDVDRIYQCTIAGTSNASIAVNGLGTDIVDGTVHWKLIGDNLNPGAGCVDASATATVTGPIVAVAGDVTQIVTSVFGLDQVTNLVNAAPGRDLGADDELRTLREQELQGEGVSPPDAIRAALLKLDDVVSVTVFVNNTDVTDASVTPAMPPHSVEALVRTGADWLLGDPRDQQIYDLLLSNVAAGIQTTGNQTGTSNDSQGIGHTIKFSRPTEVPIYVVLNVVVDPAQWPADGVAQIQNAIATWGATVPTGKDAVSSAISAKAFGITGVLDVSSCFIGTAPGPSSSATVSIDSRHLATYATANITVNVTNGTP